MRTSVTDRLPLGKEPLLRGADVATLVLRVLAAGESFTAAAAGPGSPVGLSADGVADFVALSFAAHQARLAGERVLTAGEVADVVDELASAGLIATQSGGALALSDLGRLAGGGVIGARGVLTLARALAGVPATTFSHPISGPATVLAAAQLTPELDAVYISVNGRGVAKEIQTFYGELQRQGAWVAGSLRQAPERTAAARAKKAVACLLWTHGVPRAQIDQALTRHEREQHAAGTAQAVTARTADVLPVVVEVVRLTHPDLSPDTLAALTDTLPVQLDLGVPASCAPLGRHFGQALPRSYYLRLSDVARPCPSNSSPPEPTPSPPSSLPTWARPPPMSSIACCGGQPIRTNPGHPRSPSSCPAPATSTRCRPEAEPATPSPAQPYG